MSLIREQNTIRHMKQRRTLTTDEITAAENLKKIWEKKQLELGFTQESAALDMGWTTQGTVSQYLLGKIPLNINAVIKFANYLDVAPSEIDPSLKIQFGRKAKYEINDRPATYNSKATYSEKTIYEASLVLENALNKHNKALTPTKKSELLITLLQLWGESSEPALNKLIVRLLNLASD